MKLTVKPTLREPSDPEEDPIINFRLTPEEFEEAVDTHGMEEEEWLRGIQEKHVEPTERQAALIEEAFSAIEEKLSSYGFDIPAIRRNRPAILFLSRKDYWQEKYGKEEKHNNPDTLGFYEPNANTVILWYKQTAWGKDQRNQEFLHTLTHELIHAYGLRILQAYRAKDGEGKPVISAHRAGLYIGKLGWPEEILFSGLDEALTEDMAVEITNTMLNEQCLGEFKDVVRAQVQYLLRPRRGNALLERAVSLGYQEKIPSRDPAHLAHLDAFEQEIQAMCQKNAQIIDTLLREGYSYEYPSLYQAYHKERKVLDRLIMVLARKCPEYKGKEEELRKLFYEAKFSGSMLKIGRLIERTLGNGTFRLIAEDFLGKNLQDRLRLYKKKGQ